MLHSHFQFLSGLYINKYTAEIMHLIVRIFIHFSFWALKFTLPACRPNIAAVALVTYKAEKASHYYYYYYYYYYYRYYLLYAGYLHIYS
jgi:hypothetical protein